MAADLHSLATATKGVLREIAKHANGLATGLQNAAPPQEGGPGKSILYLTEIATDLEELIRVIDNPSTTASFRKDL